MAIIPVISTIVVTTMRIEVSGSVVQNNTCDRFSDAFNETAYKKLPGFRGKARCRSELALSCGHNDARTTEAVDGRFGADCVEKITAFSTVVNPRRSLSATPPACVGRPLCAGRPREKLQGVLTMAIEVQFSWKLSTAGMNVEVTDIAAVGESLEGMTADIAPGLDESCSELVVEDERVLAVVWMGDGRRSLGTEFMDVDVAPIASVSSPGSMFLASMATEQRCWGYKG